MLESLIKWFGESSKYVSVRIGANSGSIPSHASIKKDY